MLSKEQLDRFNNLIGTTSAKVIVDLMREHEVSRDQLPALQTAGCRDKYLYVLADDHEKDWQSIQPKINVASSAAINTLKSFIDEWEMVKNQDNFTGPHIQDAKDKIAEINKALVAGYSQQEENEWQNVLNVSYNSDIGKVKAIIAHIEKWKAQGLATHVGQADNEVWDVLLRMSLANDGDLISAVSSYRNIFANDALHKGEADETFNSYSPWLQAKGSGDIFTVHNFICDYHSSLFVHAANDLLDQLKVVEIEKMKRLMDEYPGDALFALLKNKIFSQNELIGAEVATEQGIEILNNLAKAKDNLPDLKDVQADCKTSCASGRTDIYLFGTPATGKTCILMGLIGAETLHANFAESAGEYAKALHLYLVNGFLPGQTEKNFVATVQATITEKGNKHKLNLVELAGEDFAENVANGSDGNLEFAQMGDGVPALLANNNRKVFFLIVDPTSKTLKVKRIVDKMGSDGKPIIKKDTDGKPIIKKDDNGDPIYKKDKEGNLLVNINGDNEYEYETEKTTQTFIIDQFSSLKTMIDMLASSKNKAVMEKVEAVHFILTKCDKLGGELERDDKAYKLFMRRYRGLIEPLTELCGEHGINQHPDKELNGVPRLFTFSLGNFFPGGYFQYEDADANLLIETIAKCTVAVRPKTIWDRFCDFMNKPRF